MTTTLHDEINYVTLLPPSDAARKRVLIFFVPGNPGLVEYYRRFLVILRQHLNERVSQTNAQYFLSGASLAGFDVSPGSRQVTTSDQGFPLSLDAQVEDVYERLTSIVTRVRNEYNIDGDLPVVLIGHSIGAYMVLQTVAKWQELVGQGPTGIQLSAGLCLFPTIYELALSSTGRKVSPLTKIPAFAFVVHAISKALFYFAPVAIVTWLVRLITRMPDSGVNITAQFLQSKYGVWQALHMAKDELAQLTHDRWSDEFWGTPKVLDAAVDKPAGGDAGTIQAQHSQSSSSHTQLYFYWGSDDHWIAQDTRDKIIQTRAKVQGQTGDDRKPTMEIDGNGIGHAFCLSESGNQIVAAKCADWISNLAR